MLPANSFIPNFISGYEALLIKVDKDFDLWVLDLTSKGISLSAVLIKKSSSRVEFSLLYNRV